MNFLFKKVASAVTLVILAVPSISIAQERLLEEIVVTSTKRALTLQDIPISVSVVSGITIETAQIQDIADLQSVVPTLRVSQNQSSINTSYSIRGFGNGGNNPGIEPSVGVFIDGVYRSRAGSSISDFPNLERIEVLSGPQSTLFGKNASAGVISIVTQKPSGERASKLSASLGNYGAVVLKGYYENAISDQIAISIAASSNTRDGYNTNLVTGGDLNNRNRQAIRGQLLLSPSDTTEVRIIADYDQIDEECCGVVNVVSGPVTQAINFAGGQMIPNQRFTTDSLIDTDPSNELENSGVSIQIDKKFNEFSLTSITSYRNTDTFYNIDADYSSADIIQNTRFDEFDTVTQEVRLTSNGGEKLDWMIGGFYFDESVDHRDELPFNADFRPFVNFLAAIPVPGLPVTITANQANFINVIERLVGVPIGTFYTDGAGFSHVATLENEAISLFGQLDFNINHRLTATVGLNYTKDEKEATVTQTQRNAFSDIDLDKLAAEVFQAQTGFLLAPQTSAMVAGSSAAGAQLAGLVDALQSDSVAGLQFTRPIADLPNAVEANKTDDDDLTYNLRLTYDLNDSVNLYGGYSTGFKASSWNLSRNSAPTITDLGSVASVLGTPNLIAGTRFAGPEVATVFEVGVKAKFDRGAFNIALFDQTIKGFQSNEFTGTGFNLTNAGEQSVQGAEFDITYYPTDRLELKLAGTLLDPFFNDFKGAGRNAQTGETFDLTGRTPGGIAETSLSFSANYRVSFGDNDGFLNADYFFEDTVEVATPIPENPVLNTGQFTRETKNLNLSAGLMTSNGLGVSLWVRNATDHETLTTAFVGVAQALTFSGYRNQPRTYGVTVTKDF
jgi:iron complex outermembrane receptor protein